MKNKYVTKKSLAEKINDFMKNLDTYEYQDCSEVGETDEDNIRKLDSYLKNNPTAPLEYLNYFLNLKKYSLDSLTDDEIIIADELINELFQLQALKEVS